MRVLVLYGDYFHPGQAARAGLDQLVKANPELDFEWVGDTGDWSPETLSNYHLVILTKSDHTSPTDKTPWMTPEIEHAFQDYVGQGHGLLAIHSGTAGYAGAKVLRSLLGGVFDHHPAQCEVNIEPQPGHSLTEAINPFTVFDEHYFMDTGPGNDVFLATHSEHGAQPGGWTRQEGQGRVCVLTPGHNPEVWLHPEYQALLQRAILWASKRT